MCEPATITMLGLAAASALYAHKESADYATDQATAINKENHMETEDAVRQRQQAAASAAAEMNDQNRQAMKDGALLDTVTGEFGGGKTTDRAAAVASLRDDESLASLTNKSRATQSEIGFQARAANARAVAQIGAIQKPSNIGTALTIANAGASSYNSYSRQQALLKAKA